jgi:class I fructose-bisphosphate aldolase
VVDPAPEVVVHDLAQARAVLAVAAEIGCAVQLRSAPDAAGYAGVGFLHALGQAAGQPLLIDCGADAGQVMAALRMGAGPLAFSGPDELFQRLADMASQLCVELRHETRPAPALCLMPSDDARARAKAWLADDPATPPPIATTLRRKSPVPKRGGPPMPFTPKVKEILSWYEGESPGVKANLSRLLMHGRLAGTGKLVILPVDQGYEHGPARSFAANPAAYDPHYLYQLALDAGLSGYAAPLGLLEQGADSFAGQVPTILKLNSANSLATGLADQAVHGSISDALRLGCVGIGFTIYPGSDACYDMMEELRELTLEAKACGLIAVVWSYPRGGAVTKAGETALDIIAYAAHMAALMGANIIKVKPPTDHLDLAAAKTVYEAQDIDRSTLAARVRHVMQCAFAGKRVVVFSGGEAKDTAGVLAEIRQIRDGGGNGSIIGRNSFQRPRDEALSLLDEVVKIYLNQA